MMNEAQKDKIERMRKKGAGCGEISKELGLNRETVKSYCRRHGLAGIAKKEVQAGTYNDVKLSYCRNCGAPIEQNPKRKQKIFCCDKCRRKWWSKNRNQTNRKANYEFICACCGKKFTAYGNRNRKYCCFDCYIKDRFGTEQVE